MKVVLFGSGGGAVNFLEKQKEYEVLYIVDNDVAKQGKTLLGYEIKSPSSLKDHSYNIMITSMYVTEIKYQLVNQLNIDESRIIFPSKQLLKSESYAFEDKNTHKYATNLLRNLIILFNKEDVEYFLDYGTLLGVVRDGDLIEWDEDIDFKVKDECKKDLLNILNSFIVDNPSVSLKYDEASGIRLFIAHSNIKPFTIDFEVLKESSEGYFTNEYTFPREFFTQSSIYRWGSLDVKVSRLYEKYLVYIYGNDWKIPKKSFSFADYNEIEV
ncbi:LicD family protein [Lysinibacillus sp. NPDC058147]|uniref:LicD family protein n=1 Tax=unclassified Lysinibacillus TaxID=2636778 RepID=UPI0036DE4811